MSAYTFTIMEADPKYPGITGSYADPKLAAYQYMARLQIQGKLTSAVFHADGAVSVSAPGLETLTFAPDIR